MNISVPQLNSILSTLAILISILSSRIVSRILRFLGATFNLCTRYLLFLKSITFVCPIFFNINCGFCLLNFVSVLYLIVEEEMDIISRSQDFLCLILVYKFTKIKISVFHSVLYFFLYLLLNTDSPYR